MRVELYASHELEEDIHNEVTICQDGVEYLGDFAEIILQFTRAAGYTYIKQVVFVKDNNEEVATVR
jgi:hypothetical protein